MKRRDFLRSAGIFSAGLAMPNSARLFAADVSPSTRWRTFEVTTRVEVLKSSGATRVWLPAPLINPSPFQKTLSNKFSAEGGSARFIGGGAEAPGILAAEFPARATPVVTLTSRIATKDYAVNISEPARVPKAEPAELERFLRPTKLLPTDGIVKETATQITKGASGDVEKARAIYEWIVDNTFRDPKTRGCGL
jgi:transglutaminase-like putative cysteine protease